MSQCVPSWNIDDNPSSSPKLCFRSHSNSSTPDVPMLDYEVAELTWKNGHLAMHGLGPPRVPVKPIPPSSSPSKYGTTWDKPRAGGTLESIVNQATRMPCEQLINKPMVVVSGAGGGKVDELVPWFDHHRAAAVVAAASASASSTMIMDAMVPCSNGTSNHHQQDHAAAAHLMESSHQSQGVCSTRVGSCSTQQDADAGFVGAKRARVARVPMAPTPPEWSSRDQSVSQSATFRDSQHVTMDTCEREMGFGFTSTSFGSHENTSSGQQGTKTVTADENDSVCHSRPQREGGDDEEGKTKGNGKSSVSTKRRRAAAIHNQSERKRRDKINQRMKTLQKLVPNSSKTDKASMLDEVIEYLKQLQAQIQMMGRMNMQPMMMPMAMQQQLQQQLQMSMMAPVTMGMGMGIGMGMGMMDMNAINRTPNMSPVLHPNAFMPMHSWDGSYDRLQTTPTAPTTVMPDPMQAAFLACQSQPMSMDAYSRMAAMYQQLHQQNNASSYKN